jgi:hypothetical protein
MRDNCKAKVLAVATIVALTMTLPSRAEGAIAFLKGWGTFGSGNGQFWYFNGLVVRQSIVDRFNHGV